MQTNIPVMILTDYLERSINELNPALGLERLTSDIRSSQEEAGRCLDGPVTASVELKEDRILIIWSPS